ncbi:WXG100 family type VII secretion target [Mycobacterium sp. M1]|uniref:WXG100 family type VII secretion target n=1 Tax=Mycolicibacter acidiphilus TaxID=2835306 RepID=A0ABS5RES7_9MYCO|nr:hypothetical protein [Mycolicibacter acidiphilus]MBS9532786.1 WXG100 family type VII secretion target [Mycolicibacter acidiphilus]
MLTVPQVLDANADALTTGAGELSASITALDSQIADQRAKLSQLQAAWEGRASSAAQDHLSERISGQEQHRDRLRSLQQAMASGGQEMAGIRAQLREAVDSAQASGWEVADDGSVSPGSVLNQLAETSSVMSMELALMGMQFTSQIKTKLAEFTWADLRAGAEIRKFDDTLEAPPTDVPEPQPQPDPPHKANPADIADQVLDRDASELKGSGDLPMDPNVPNDVCCANFVTATLQKAGLIDWHSNQVAETSQRLQAQGWRVVPASEARPGDVAIINGNEHTELVSANNNGQLTLIGSNNVNPDGSQRISYGHPYGNVVYLSPP